MMESRIMYRKIQNEKRTRLKLQAYGYKNFSKVSACGEDTPLTLQNLSQAHCMRYIRKLEFDPYLCEKSHMKALCKVLMKFKDLSNLNLVIRRLDYMNESDRLEHIFPRLLRLKKLRLELSKIENLDDNGMMRFGKSFGRLYSLRECEQIMVGMDHISQLANMHFTKYGSKLTLCQKFMKKLVKATLLTKPDPALQEMEEKFMLKLKPGRCLKEAYMHFILPQGWLSMSTDVDESAASSLRLLAFQKKLEKFHIGFCGNPVALETIQSLSEGISNLAYLNTLSIEFLNSRVSENEIVLFAQLLLELKALKKLTFKVIQFPNISEGCICYLLTVLSKLQNIKQFRVYFRRLDTSSDMIQEVLRRSESLNNIQCWVSKQSLAFTRDEKED